MKKIIKSYFTLILALTFGTTLYAQTSAMQFAGEDCSSNQVDLFADLDAGKAVVLFFYMPNCGSCPPKAQKIQAMANKINSDHPGLVKGYAFPYQNSTTCTYSQTWVSSNNVPLYAAMDSGAAQVAYYGGFGMPTVVLLGGDNHDVLFVTQNFVNGDTTTMRDLILNTLTAGIEENGSQEFQFEAFPNPSNDWLTVRFPDLTDGETKIELVDLEGKVILNEETSNESNSTNEKILNVSAVENGTYILRIQHKEMIRSEKITILH